MKIQVNKLAPVIYFAMAIIMLMLSTKMRFAVFIVALLLSAGADAEGSPHWNKDGCQICHVDAAPVAGNISLHEPDAETLCVTCHGDRGDALPCRHASGIPVGDMNIAETFSGALQDDKVVCTTCHDVVYQCERPKLYYSYENPGFLRDRDYAKTGEYCYECHESADYEKLSPHTGVAGNPLRPSCLVCHSSLPETSSTGRLVVEFNMQHDLNDTCQGCHNVRPHPINMFASEKSDKWIHLVVPPDEIAENMGIYEQETGVALPLNSQNGEIFCATCHNPHDFKVGGGHGSEARDMKHRLRLANICQACHDK